MSAAHIYPLSVVIPIHNAREDVARCVDGVRRHAPAAVRIILVDDASTDADLCSWLREQAQADGRVELLRQEVNQGYVVAANRGMRHAQGSDVLLLNSDTVVPARFVESLQACAYADDRTGVVSPLSNNATICSVPRFVENNPLPSPDAFDTIAARVAETSERSYPELPTAHGFCMYIRANVIARIGLFHAERYGRGYGEENDFCERAQAAGFRVRLCDHLYVAHRGEASFGAEADVLRTQAIERLAADHPGYAGRIADFIERNPLRPVQKRVAFVVRRSARRTTPALLHVLHLDPYARQRGGVQLHVQDLVRHSRLPRVLVAWPDGPAISAAEILDGEWDRALRYQFPVASRPERCKIRDDAMAARFGELLHLFGVSAVHLHHLLGWPVALGDVLQARGLPYVYTIHDYYCVCPSLNLLDLSRQPARRCSAQSFDETACPACLAAYGRGWRETVMPVQATSWKAHRAAFRALLAGARQVIAPSRCALETVTQGLAWSDGRTTVIPHASLLTEAPPRPSAARNDARTGPLRIGLVGRVGAPEKGADRYLALLDRLRDVPCAWHVFGDVGQGAFAQQLRRCFQKDWGLLHGAYAQSDIVDLLREADLDLTLSLSVAAEAFCYAVDESWAATVPVLALEGGAPAERIREQGGGRVFADLDALADQLRNLQQDRAPLAGWREEILTARRMTLAAYKAAYRDLYDPWVQGTVPPASRQQEELLLSAYQHAQPPAAPLSTASSRWSRLAWRMRHHARIRLERSAWGCRWLAAYRRWRHRARARRVTEDGQDAAPPSMQEN